MITRGGIKLFGVAGAGKTTACMKILMEFLGTNTDLSSELKEKIKQADIKNLEITDIAFTSFTKASITSITEKINEESNIIIPKHSESWIRTLNSATWKLSNFNETNFITKKKLVTFFKSQNIEFEREEGEEQMSAGELIQDIYNSLLNTLGRGVNRLSDSEIELFLIEDYQKKNFQVFENYNVDFLIAKLRTYDEWKIENNLKDYIDSLIFVLENKIDIPCKILIVDEAQDLSFIQTKIVDMWIEDFNKDFFIIAGDDDQTVHEWNGAKPEYLIKVNCENMLNHKLERTYRMPLNVSMFCNEILKMINYRERKTITSKKPDGDIIYNPNYSIYNLNLFLDNYDKSSETSFLLFRTNKAKEIASNFFFNQTNLIFGDLNGRGRYTKKLIMVSNALNKIDHKQGLTKQELSYLFECLPTKTCLIFGSKSKVIKSDKSFYKFEEVLDLTKLWKPQKTLDNSDFKDSLKENIIKYLQYVSINKNDVENIKKNEMYLLKFKNIKTQIKYNENDKKSYCNIMLGTYHASKGLQADNVFVFLGTSEYFKHINDSELRCFYVACSRTIKRLFLISSQKNEKPYLEEHFKDLIMSMRNF